MTRAKSKNLILPGAIQRARHLLAGRTISSTDAALIKPPAGADDAVASGLDTLALNAHCGGVWAAGCAVGHLEAAEGQEWNVIFGRAVT